VNTFQVDLATPAFYEWPLDRFIGLTLRGGELPLWNPHQAAGAPVVANYSTRVFFPYQMLLDVSPLAWWDYAFVLRLWIAGWLTYCFLARAGLGWTAAALGGLFYMLSGAFTWFVNLEQFVNAAMVIPLLFLAVEAFVSKADARRAAYIALATGLTLLAGQPEIAIYALIAAGLYGIVRARAGPGHAAGARSLMAWGPPAVLLGFAVAAPVLLPFAAHLPRAFHLHVVGMEMGVRAPAPASFAVSLFVPSFFELPTFLRAMPDNGQWDYLGGYGGVLAVFLALAGLAGPQWSAAPRRRGPLLFFTVVCAWIVLKNFGIQPFDWIGRLPLLNQVWTPRWAGPTWCFALSVGAAFGLARFEEARDRGRAVLARVLLALTVVLIGVALLAALAMSTLDAFVAPLWDFVWPGAVGGQVVAAAILALSAVILLRLEGIPLAVTLLGLAVVERWLPIPRGYAPAWLALRLVPVGLGLAAVGLCVFRRRFLAGACASAALVAALGLDFTAPFGLPDRPRDPAMPPPVVEFLKARAGYDRIMGDHRVIPPNYASVFGLYDVRSVDALAVDWFAGFVSEGLRTSSPAWWHALWFTGNSPPYEQATLQRDLWLRRRGYSLLSVRYIVAPPDVDLNADTRGELGRLPVVYRDDAVVWENPAALPRAFVVGEWTSAPDSARARGLALSGAFDLREVAVVEGAPAGGGGAHGHAEIVAYAATRVALDVEASGPALVVLTDTFYPGWRATIDGAPAPVYRVDGIVRGVFVGAGRHRVAMRFFPPSQALGFGLAAVALTVLGCMLARPRARDGPPREPAHRRSRSLEVAPSPAVKSG
jgi:hypothetical protein